MWVLGILVIGFVTICFILIPPSKGTINPILDEEGKEVNGSISEKTVIDVNGTQLGIILLGRDENKPVLLFLGGGPGIPEYFLEYQYPSHLEDEFVVCFLEHRGTTRSYNFKIDKSTMTTEQYIDDVVDVTRYLCQRFGQEKVYLMAHSFGTYIGLNTIKLFPELFYAFIPISQMCNQKESETMTYDYMLKHYRQVGDKNKINRLNSYNIRESKSDFEKYRISMTRDNSMHELGIGTMRNMNSIIKDIVLASLKCIAYTPKERITIFIGKMFAQKTQVAEDAWNFNAFEKIPEVKVPVYFFAGEYDYTCCYELQKTYFEQLLAPEKYFYSFENSAHSPLFEENDRAMDILRRDIIREDLQ